jgi:hypothetical protein
MSPEERQETGPRIHGLREAVTEALGMRKARWSGWRSTRASPARRST